MNPNTIEYSYQNNKSLKAADKQLPQLGIKCMFSSTLFTFFVFFSCTDFLLTHFSFSQKTSRDTTRSLISTVSSSISLMPLFSFSSYLTNSYPFNECISISLMSNVKLFFFSSSQNPLTLLITSFQHLKLWMNLFQWELQIKTWKSFS